jgi:hypothetical protein
MILLIAYSNELSSVQFDEGLHGQSDECEVGSLAAEVGEIGGIERDFQKIPVNWRGEAVAQTA